MLLQSRCIVESRPGETDLGVLVIGNRGGSNIGESFARACEQIHITGAQIESKEAMRGPALLRRISWRLHDRQPLRLNQFSADVARFCRARRPAVLLAMGIAPLTANALGAIGNLGSFRALYLTDDPWSPYQRAKWFLRALPSYDHVFTTRRANVCDLQELGIRRVSYLPFGWDPVLCPDRTYSEDDLSAYRADVMFAGGGDRDRVQYFAALAQAGFTVALYGTYWDRFPETRKLTRGQLPASELPKAIAGAKVALCLVRRVNRDGHCMRTFEVPACGGCMLAEDTAEHREILGPDGEAVIYFRSIDEMLPKARLLIEDPQLRGRLAAAASARIRTSSNTYAQRLMDILAAAELR